MANERLIKGRIKSAKNISQITKAMQMVAASKMKKAQAAALASRPYAEKIAQATQEFASRVSRKLHPLLAVNASGKRLIILISTNKGLLGGLNTTLFRELVARFGLDGLKDSVFATMGKKGELFLVRTHQSLLADFSTQPFTASIPALTTFLVDGYLKHEFKEVYLVYNNFISALKQEPSIKLLLPIGVIAHETEQTKQEAADMLIEPSVEDVLDELLFHYLENQIRDAVLEAEASEHSARMIAMKNATENALELSKLLTLEYNKARQEKITYEISDIVTARIAVE